MIAALVLGSSAPDGIAASLAALHTESSTGAVWRTPTIHRRDVLREAMSSLLAAAQACPGATVQDVQRGLEAEGLEVVRLVHGEEKILVIRESAGHRFGAGFFAIRCGEAEPWAVQAPHSFFDLYTGTIVLSIFAASRARAGFWNTVHRYKSRPGEQRADRIHPADVAHEYGNLFHAATAGAALGDPSLRFVQLHGFAREGLEFDVILSSGNPDHPPLRFGAAVEQLWPRVGIYGRDTSAYAGTQNVQRQALAVVSQRRFMHFEMTRAVRESLRDDPDERRRLIDALAQPWW